MKISTEILTHYQCGSCENEWSILGHLVTSKLYCTHCGIKRMRYGNMKCEDQKMKTHAITITYHQCASCEQKWSVPSQTTTAKLYCPSCGDRQKDSVIWRTMLHGGLKASYNGSHCYLYKDGYFSGYAYLLAAHWIGGGSMAFDADDIEDAKLKVEKSIMAQYS